MTPGFLSHTSAPLSEVETFSKPGTADVTVGDRKKLKGILGHYGTAPHGFTKCKKDQIKHGLSEDHANRRCAVIMDLAKGTTKWRGKAKEEAVEILGEALEYVHEALATEGAALLQEAKLTSKSRSSLPGTAFALSGRRYPIHDESHARNALARVAENGTDSEKKAVRAAVAKKYPKMGESEESMREAEQLGQIAEEVAAALSLIEAAPNWMLPVAARKSGFKPTNPEKPSSSTNSEFNSKHPRGSGTQGGQFISKGSSGREVTAVQHRLGIARTGTYGGNTKTRVEKFQKNHGLQVDGIVGAQTVAALRGNTSVSPGALTKNDRRYLRRYAKRT